MSGDHALSFSCALLRDILRWIYRRIIHEVSDAAASVSPAGMLGRYRLQAIDNERKLERQWLFAPQGPIVVEDRDPIFCFDEMRVPGRGHSTDKVYDALLRGAFVPGRKGILDLDILFERQRT